MSEVKDDFAHEEELTYQEINDMAEHVNALGFKDVLNAGETINGGTAACYQNQSDNELYKCDASDLEKILFLGFAISNSTNGNPIEMQLTGIVGGFSGLEEGVKYYLAMAGSSHSDISETPASESSDIVIGTSGVEDRRCIYFTITNPTKLTKLTLSKVKKNGSPTGNLVCSLRNGSPSGSDQGGGTLEIASASKPYTDFTTSYASYDFNFGGVVLPAGTYGLMIYHDTLSDGNYFKISTDDGSVGSSTILKWTAGYSWTSTSSRKADYNIDFINESFTAGQITDYFYTYKKEVGIAISATEIVIIDKKELTYIGSQDLTEGENTITAGFQDHWNMCVVQIVSYTAGSGIYNRGDVIITKTGKRTGTIGAGYNSSGGTVTFSGGSILELVEVGSATTLTATAYYYM